MVVPNPELEQRQQIYDTLIFKQANDNDPTNESHEGCKCHHNDLSAPELLINAQSMKQKPPQPLQSALNEHELASDHKRPSCYCRQPANAIIRNHYHWPVSSIIKPAQAIRLLRLDAPRTVIAGQPIRLRCFYDTKGDKLQSLSWYKNGREFYRYQPFERRQPVLAFNLTGVNVDVSR